MNTENLQNWMQLNPIDEKMIYRSAAYGQMIKIRYNLCSLFHNMIPWLTDENSKIEVVSTHTSRSIKLPVYKITINIPGPGTQVIEIILSDNFYDWCVIVNQKWNMEPYQNILDKGFYEGMDNYKNYPTRFCVVNWELLCCIFWDKSRK